MRWRFFARRLAMLVASLLVASFVIFAALYLAPGNPLAALSGGRSLPPSSIQVLEERYHLNEPFLAQYWHWLDNALHGNLGISITLRENVSSLIASRIWTTAGLVLYASLIILALGIGIGIVSGLRPGVPDTATLVTTAVSAAIPAFVAAIVLILLFAVKLGWFPALGNGTDFLSNVRHFTLPALALATASLAIVARVTRTSVREEGDREHVQTAVSRGIPPRNVIQRHILRNAAIPITTIAGITIAGAQTAMLGPLAVVIASMTAGTLIAVTAAWRRGATDAVISSGLDILFAFPGILFAVLAAAVFGAGLAAASIALSIAYMPYVARVLRGAALKERSQPYVAALEVQGASATSICLRHLVPNIAPLIVAQATILFGYAMVDLAAISFLGLGVQPPDPNWGVMISENQSGILQGYPLPALAAGVCIVTVVIAVNVLGERLFDQAQAAR